MKEVIIYIFYHRYSKTFSDFLWFERSNNISSIFQDFLSFSLIWKKSIVYYIIYHRYSKTFSLFLWFERSNNIYILSSILQDLLSFSLIWKKSIVYYIIFCGYPIDQPFQSWLDFIEEVYIVNKERKREKAEMSDKSRNEYTYYIDPCWLRAWYGRSSWAGGAGVSLFYQIQKIKYILSCFVVQIYIYISTREKERKREIVVVIVVVIVFFFGSTYPLPEVGGSASVAHSNEQGRRLWRLFGSTFPKGWEGWEGWEARSYYFSFWDFPSQLIIIIIIIIIITFRYQHFFVTQQPFIFYPHLTPHWRRIFYQDHTSRLW